MAVIEVEGLRKRYGTTVAVDDVSFTVEKGEIFGILGPNGAGKTTTVECLVGLRNSDAGRISVLGLDPRRDRNRLRQLVGVQLQQGILPEKLRVGEAVRLYRSFYSEGADPDRLLADLGLDGKRRTAFGDLSGGQQQRLAIALALVGNPVVAVLDELTTGLDPQARRNTWQLIDEIRESGVTVLLVTHLMEEAERLCDRIAVIDRGRLVALDTPLGLIRQAALDQELTFRVTEPFDHAVLAALPEVSGVVADGDEVRVSGSGNLLYAVSSALIGLGVVATETRLRQAQLDDAFLALTGRELRPNDSSTPEEDR
ncbi:ABC transporter ATP-binding protein [Micromonospora sonneratiae]|uniref:ABC transporter ATP-binding protein n=1 Tax=Micromonospora sonneratiae TaxID=1184706 RepID=A0ABW3YEB0_9ACTN